MLLIGMLELGCINDGVVWSDEGEAYGNREGNAKGRAKRGEERALLKL